MSAEQLRLVLVGAGGMGRAWAQVIRDNPHAALVGVVDIDEQAARDVAGNDAVAGTDVLEVARASGATAVVDVTIPAAHHPITTAALLAGYDVLGEKPVTETVAQALSLVAATHLSGRRFIVSQSRRFNVQAFRYRAFARALGTAGTLASEFFKAPHFGGFREEMAHPLLVDMAIHQLDLARFLLDADPVAVYAESFNPPWSWFDGDASAIATFEMSTGARYVFTGSWCAPGLETSWNAAWRLSSEHGSATWDGDGDPVLGATSEVDVADVVDPGRELSGSLAAFVAGIGDPEPMMGEVADNVLSLAMVEAAVESAETGMRVAIDDVLSRAYETALADEARDDVREVLAGWGSARAGLALSD